MTCIVVLGCFRSGTSAVAGTLHHLGIFMGEKFTDPNKNNPKGFFEDQEFKHLHEAYEDCQTDSYDKGTWIDQHYKNLIDSRNARHTIWGVKDPLFCQYLSKFTSFCPDTKVIVCRRSVDQIAESMARAVGINNIFTSIAQGYVDQMNESLALYQGPVLEIHKQAPMIDILDPICEFVGFPKTQQAIDFLS